jgi:exodeoxyribonuclease VII large subunit
VLAQWAQQTDLLAQELTQRSNRALNGALDLTERLALHLAARHPARWVAQRQQSLDALGSRLRSALAFRLAGAAERLDRATSLVNSLGPQRVLDRGFTYTTGPDGHPLGDLARLRVGDRLTTRTATGQVASTVATVPMRPSPPDSPR